MTKHDDNQDKAIESRRRFLKLAAGTAAVAAVAGTSALPRIARAEGGDLPPLSESAANAKALHYVEDAKTSKNPKHKAGDDCSNCMFYKGNPGDPRGGCQLFPGKSVNAHGWCVSHHTKA